MDVESVGDLVDLASVIRDSLRIWKVIQLPMYVLFPPLRVVGCSRHRPSMVPAVAVTSCIPPVDSRLQTRLILIPPR